MQILLANHCRIPPFPFRKTPTKDQKTWDSILKNQAKLKNDQAILASLAEMEASGIWPSKATLPLVLKACSRLQDVNIGKHVHSLIVESSLINDVRIRTALIDFYCKCGLIDVARELFDGMREGDLVSWNAMICGYVGSLKHEDAMALFFEMRKRGLKPGAVTLVSLLSALGDMSEFRAGREIHCYCLRNGFFDSEVHVGSALVSFYSTFDVKLSQHVFDSMKMKNLVCWNALISEHFNAGNVGKALELFVQLIMTGLVPDSVTFLSVLQSCGEVECLELGKQVHQLAIKHGFSDDNFVENALVSMYGKCGSLESACDVFDKMLSGDLASWNAMLSAYKNCNCYEKAFDVFNLMLLVGMENNAITITTILLMCTESGELKKGKQLHAYAIKTGKEKAVGAALLSMYADLNCVVSALIVFNAIEKLDTATWNTLITSLFRNELASEAWDLFRQMQESRTKSNSYTMVSLLEGCNNKSHLRVGKSIHGYILRHSLEINSSLCTALTDMYMDCGNEPSALYLFWRYPDKDIVSWNAMIASYVQNGQPREALCLLYQMQSEVHPNSTTIISVLQSCADMADLEQGRSLHAYTIRRQLFLASEISLENALLTMYAKCGRIDNAATIFSNLSGKDVISWNAMIAAYGMHGHGEEALRIFYDMLETGEKPTSVTFISILSACSHAGLVEEGAEIFNSMTAVHDIVPEVVHYSCMVDLLGRTGVLDEASSLIRLMPLKPDPSLLRAHLSAYRISPKATTARSVGKQLIDLEPLNTGNYILLSNIYAAAGRWEDVKTLRSEIKEKNLKKAPGVSWILIRNHVHTFTAGDTSHPWFDQISETLRLLANMLMESRYILLLALAWPKR